MEKPTKRTFILFGIQAGAWAAVILLPVLTSWFITKDWGSTKNAIQMARGLLLSPMVMYFANFYILDRWLFQRRRYGWFALANLLLMAWLNWNLFLILSYAPPGMTNEAWIGWGVSMIIYFLLNCAMVALALGIRHFIRMSHIHQQLQEEQQRHTEAELAWLKNQINPHFLFNTLNNISSLAAIDSEAYLPAFQAYLAQRMK